MPAGRFPGSRPATPLNMDTVACLAEAATVFLIPEQRMFAMTIKRSSSATTRVSVEGSARHSGLSTKTVWRRMSVGSPPGFQACDSHLCRTQDPREPTAGTVGSRVLRLLFEAGRRATSFPISSTPPTQVRVSVEPAGSVAARVSTPRCIARFEAGSLALTPDSGVRR